MTAASKQEMLKSYVGDMQSLVGHGLQALEGQLKNIRGERHAGALLALDALRQTLKGQRSSLEARLKDLGGSAASPLKEALSRVLGLAVNATRSNAARSEEVARSVRDDYTFVSHCAMAYLMLFTTAEALGDNETAGLAERGYTECARMAITMDRVMPSLVLQELKQEGHPVVDVTERVRDMVRCAWQREAVPAF